MKRLRYSTLRTYFSSCRELLLPSFVLISGIIFQNVASIVPWLVERLYSRNIYPHVLGALSILSRSLNFSLGEILLCFAQLIICVSLVLFGLGLFRKKGRRRSWVLVWLRCGAWVAAGLVWGFLLTFGLNYQRPLLFEQLGYEQRKADPSELEGLGRMLVARVNRTYEEAHAGGGSMPESREIVKLVHDSYDTATTFSLFPRGDFSPPKPVYMSEVLTRFGISGVYFPFTAEPNYNADVPDFQLPFSIAHEMAHQRGVARESEANFVAYVICINSSNPFVRYSGYRNGLGVLSELSKVEPEKARELAKLLGSGYREDSRRAAQFWAKASGATGALGLRVNDLYLRANRVKAGAADYSNSTILIIAYHLRERSGGGADVPR